MTPGLALLTRWALYADAGLIFGLPLMAQLLGARSALARWRGALTTAALLFALLSPFAFLLALAGMAGTSLADLDPALIVTMLQGSSIGLALIIRCLAALACAAAIAGGAFSLAMPLAAIAIASLAWSGHAAASDGLSGDLRLAGDILHLLGASAWIGALIFFHLIRKTTDQGYAVLLALFARPGSIIVLLLIATGLGNMAFIATPESWLTMLPASYGRILLLKLAFFLLMLVLAALHRFALVPALARGERSAATMLAITLPLELAAGLLILALVTWLGTLDPMAG